MDFVFELLFQFLFEVVGEGLVELGFKGSARVLRSKIGRAVASTIAGFAFGVWWGAHLVDQGGAHRPRLFWVSIALALVAGIGAHRRWRTSAADEGQPVKILQVPWRWPLYRLVAFAALNTAIAAGIATGWHPPVLG